MASLIGNAIPKRPCPTSPGSVGRDTEPEPKKLRLDSGASDPAGPTDAPTQPPNQTRPHAPTRSATFNNGDKVHNVYGRREYNTDESRRRDSDSSAFTSLGPPRRSSTMRSPECSSRAGSSANTPSVGRSPLVRSPTTNNSPHLQSPTWNRDRPASVNDNAVMPAAPMTQDQSPGSPLHPSSSTESGSCSKSSTVIKPQSMLQQMLQTTQKSALSMFEERQVEARLAARRLEERSARKYEAGYASSKHRQLLVERAEKEAQEVQARNKQLLHDQEMHTKIVAEQLTTARKEQDNASANEKFRLLQGQIEIIQSNFKLELANRNKQFEQELEKRDQRIEKLQVALAANNEKTKRTEKTEEQLDRHDKDLDFLFGDNKRLKVDISDLRQKIKAEETKTEGLIDTDIKRLYDLLQDVKDKVGVKNLSSKEPTVASRLKSLENTVDELADSNVRVKKDIADTITELGSTMMKLEKIKTPIQSTARTNGSTNIEEVSQLIKKEIAVESEKQEEILGRLVKVVEQRLDGKIEQARKEMREQGSERAKIHTKLEDLDSRVKEMDRSLSGENHDDEDPLCVMSILGRQDDALSKHDANFEILDKIARAAVNQRDIQPLADRILALETSLGDLGSDKAPGASGVLTASSSTTNDIELSSNTQKLDDLNNAVKELQKAHDSSTGTVTLAQQALSDILNTEIEARKELSSDTYSRLLNLTLRFDGIFSKVELQKALAEDVSKVQKRLEKLEEIIQNADNTQSGSIPQAQAPRPAQVESPPPANTPMAQPVAKAFEEMDTRLLRLEKIPSAFPADQINQNLNTFSAAIHSLETRYSNLMTNDLAHSILHQLREQSMSLDPGYINGKIQHLEHSIQLLSQQLKALNTREGRNGSPELQASMQKRLVYIEAMLSRISPARQEIEYMNTGSSDTGFPTTQENGTNSPVPSVALRLNRIESGIKMLVGQLKLEALFQSDGTTEESNLLFKDAIENEIAKIAKDLNALQVLRANVNTINDILVTVTTETSDLKKDVERVEKKAESTALDLSVVRTEMVKKSQIDLFRSTFGVSSPVRAKGTHRESVSSRGTDSDSDGPLAASHRSTTRSSMIGAPTERLT